MKGWYDESSRKHTHWRAFFTKRPEVREAQVMTRNGNVSNFIVDSKTPVCCASRRGEGQALQWQVFLNAYSYVLRQRTTYLKYIRSRHSVVKSHTVCTLTKRETTIVITTRRAAAAAAAALCMHIALTSRLLRRHPSNHRTYFYTWIKRKGNVTQNKL